MSLAAQKWGRFGLGTRLRLLQERLNKDIDAFYAENDIHFKTRFYPVFQLLKDQQTLTIKGLAEAAGTSHSAMSQTISMMTELNYVSLLKGEDAREKVVTLTSEGETLLVSLNKMWAHINVTNEALMSQMTVDFYQALEQLEQALDESSLLQRLQQ